MFAEGSERGSISAYLRVASLAVAFYDWLWTFPTELAIYRQQKSLWHLRRTCLLFILIRYISIVSLVVNNVGFFSNDMPASVCAKFIYMVPAMKCVQMTIAHLILFVRTWAISTRSRWVYWTLSSLFVVVLCVELWSSLYKRVAAQDAQGNCTSGNEAGSKVDWIFYVASFIFDAVCLSIATAFLWLQTHDSSCMSGLSRVLLKEGLLFFGVLQAANILNLVVFIGATSVESQSAAASLGLTLTWIMAQRILIQLHELGCGNKGCSASLPGSTPGGGLHTLRFQTVPVFRRKVDRRSGDMEDVELSGMHVAVHVEERHGPADYLGCDLKWDRTTSWGRLGKEDADALERTEGVHVVQIGDS
ncbi:hypothetical protein B0H21DRAFT_825379 [Amylocystis lapponica]|nr:hypothetical protein B0H21DRAFT_825379 [Amylocystis lapponica]